MTTLEDTTHQESQGVALGAITLAELIALDALTEHRCGLFAELGTRSFERSLTTAIATAGRSSLIVRGLIKLNESGGVRVYPELRGVLERLERPGRHIGIAARQHGSVGAGILVESADADTPTLVIHFIGNDIFTLELIHGDITSILWGMQGQLDPSTDHQIGVFRIGRTTTEQTTRDVITVAPGIERDELAALVVSITADRPA
jgi:hypothetical protein